MVLPCAIPPLWTKNVGFFPFSHLLCNFHGGYVRLQTGFTKTTFSIATGWTEQGNDSTSQFWAGTEYSTKDTSVQHVQASLT